MCTRLEIETIIKNNLTAHELKDAERYIQLEDKLDKALIASREAIPNQFSQSIINLNGEIMEIKEHLKPIIGAYNRTDGFLSSLFFISKVFGAVGVIALAIVAFREWIKH